MSGAVAAIGAAPSASGAIQQDSGPGCAGAGGSDPPLVQAARTAGARSRARRTGAMLPRNRGAWPRRGRRATRSARMTQTGVLLLGPYEVPGLASRSVRVFLPPPDGRGPPPVLYLFDGQNLFDDAPSFAGGWHLHE